MKTFILVCKMFMFSGIVGTAITFISIGYAENSASNQTVDIKTSAFGVIKPASSNSNHIFQVATSGSLIRGLYDGNYTYGELMKKGSMGIGTFEGIDGEMVALDGKFYQFGAKGKTRQVNPNEIVPFAQVVHFRATHSGKINNIIDYSALASRAVTDLKNKNIPHAILITGTFKKLQLRSLRKQQKPYPPLVEAINVQNEYDVENIQGSLVGFWFPPYWDGIAVPGYHLHFISADKMTGGHVLEINIEDAVLASAPAYDFMIHLPHADLFSKIDLNPQDLHDDIQATEGSEI